MKKNLQYLVLGVLLFANINTTFAQDHSIAREWNEVLLTAIRNDFARPTVHARNLWHTSVAMYDIWAVYDDCAETYLLGKTVDGFTCEFDGIPIPSDAEAARHEAISYAMYRLIRHRFQNAPSPGVFTIISEANNKLIELGYTPVFTDTNYSTGSPAALGNYVAECLINYGLQDGANEQNFYNNQYYQPTNPSMITDNPGNSTIVDPNHWQPLTLDVFIDQSGNEIPFNTPPFLSPEWGNVTPFAMTEDDLTVHESDGDEYLVYHDPGDPPYLDTNQVTPISEEYLWGFTLVSKWSSHLDPSDGVMWDISPASIGNVQEYPTTIPGLRDFYDEVNGGDPSTGRTINPITGAPYAPQMVPRGDYTRVLAEFWADGPDSETPPGHWFTILNYVSDNPLLEKKFKGVVEMESDLEWDVKSYFAMGGAMHDCAIAAWGCKGWYDYIRPMSAIRYMADNGQSNFPLFPGFHPAGMPLSTGFVERVTAGDALAGTNNVNVGKIKVRAWRGPDFINNTATNTAGVDWILAERWWPYQRPSFVTPPFAGYVSGHSTYSRAAAEVLTMFTGDEYFPGGMGEFPVEMNDFLVFEEGPSQSFTLQWATYRDASDQCSLSRIWGGIHPPADDIPGRLMGIEIGTDAFLLGESYFYCDEDEDGYYDYEDCDDTNAAVYPGAPEICDALDNDCNGLADDGLPQNTYFRDSDNDGFGDINMAVDTCMMMPPTGYVTNDMDCDDTKFNVNPDATEICNGIDDNCDGSIDEGLTVTTYFVDMDGDGFGSAAGGGGVSLDTCLIVPPVGYVANDFDCNDADADIHPDSPEVCDAIDNNCNGVVNDGLILYTYYFDNDGDGFGDVLISIDTCIAVPPVDFVAIASDCNDEDATINPSASEVCDGIDNDCNGLSDDGLAKNRYYLDADGDNYGDINIMIDTCIFEPPTGYVTDDTDCDDTRSDSYPTAPEVADDGIDQDCTGKDLYEQTKIFPNPTRGNVSVHYVYTGVANLQIVDARGRVSDEGFISFEDNEAAINVQFLQTGIYFLRFSDLEGKTLFVEKLVRY